MTVVIDAEDPTVLDAARGLPFVRSYQRNGAALVELARREHVADLVDALVAGGVRLLRVEPRTPTLEELYFKIRGNQGMTTKRTSSLACVGHRARRPPPARAGRDFWVPLAIIALLFFMVIPAVMLLVISTVQDPKLREPSWATSSAACPAPAGQRHGARDRASVVHARGVLVRATRDDRAAHGVVVHQREHVRRRARARQRRVPRPLPGVERQIYLGKLMASLIPGYFTALGGFVVYSRS